MRRPLIAGNWKMTQGHADAMRLADGLKSSCVVPPDRDCAIFQPFTSLVAVAEKLRDSRIAVGAQNIWFEDDGAFTGEISANLVRAAGGTACLLGHSERRHILGESDELVGKKTRQALKVGLKPIVCVGELLAERDGGRTLEVVARQLREALRGVARDKMRDVVVAYEPVWAIGTGRVATPDQAQEVHAALRAELKSLYDAAVAAETRVLYGGSVKPNNIDGLMTMPDVDGALVGGASLDAADFSRIVRYETKSA
jgi:triosephosphate isomerase (TIM)